LAVVYLVRHAHAGKKSAWSGPDLARPLSAQGRGEALGLVDQLAGLPVGRLLSSPAVRCLQTLQPLADRLGLPIEPDDRLGADGPAGDVVELLASPVLDQAVVCTHGELIGRIFAELEDVGVQLSDRPHWPKGSTWVLDRDPAHTWRGQFLAPRSVPRAMAQALRWPSGGEEVAGP
jgi:phosphohistidine phosphatase SixA